MLPASIPTLHMGSAMDQAMGSEFNQIAFLWGGREPDPVIAALVGWKDDLLC